jgi:hypothetical protein
MRKHLDSSAIVSPINVNQAFSDCVVTEVVLYQYEKINYRRTNDDIHKIMKMMVFYPYKNQYNVDFVMYHSSGTRTITLQSTPSYKDAIEAYDAFDILSFYETLTRK